MVGAHDNGKGGKYRTRKIREPLMKKKRWKDEGENKREKRKIEKRGGEGKNYEKK